ncbi:MAG: cytochrome c [Gemmatimonadota bacterium]|nr:cytochrome c [Gemmatimonadota bacterium]
MMDIERYSRLLVCLGLAACASAPQESAPVDAPTATAPSATAPAPSQAATAGAGIFTADQASRGEAVFQNVCSECHYASEFRGRAFQATWEERTVRDFYRQIVRTMPDGEPGSLAPQEYVDVVTFVLRSNGFPVGSVELPPDDEVLRGYSMKAPESN